MLLREVYGGVKLMAVVRILGEALPLGNAQSCEEPPYRFLVDRLLMIRLFG